ncbi:MAG: DHH family phosphoesterase [Oscillospiraceae bacterium]|nr:DHH family phosphoesterase [Oscillospiraceae bacterium]
MTEQECAAWLLQRDNLLLITHRRPDGDTLGSAAALAGALRGIGKTVFVIKNPETTPRYMPIIEKFHAPEDFTPDYIIAVDTATRDLFPDAAKAYEKIDLAIDHHPSNTHYAENTRCEPERASCGEVVFSLLTQLGGEKIITPETATALYIAVSTDTGCFSYENTDSNAFHTAARLTALGADAARLNRVLFRSKTRARAEIEGMLYSDMRFPCNGQAAVAVITLDMTTRAGADEDDMENIAALPASIEGVLVGVTVRELRDNRGSKVSVRSLPGVDSNKICARFGGGGHAAAAGFTSKLSVNELVPQVISVLDELLGVTAP